MDRRKEIAENIALMVKASGKTQAQIATAIGLNKQAITDYIAGKSFPNLLRFVLLCQVLECNYEDILGRLE